MTAPAHNTGRPWLEDEDPLRRHFVAIATSAYSDPGLAQLDGVDAEVETLRGWLCAPSLADRYRFQHAHTELVSNPTKAQISAAFEGPVQSWNSNDAAVLFVTGHGLRGDGAHWLILHATDTAKRMTALRTADLVAWLKDTPVADLVVILDLCYSAATATDTIRFDTELPPGWVVLASTTKNANATTGALTGAIREFLDELTSPTGDRFHHGPHLKIGDFVEEVQARLAAKGQRLALLHTPDFARTSVCLPHPRHRPTNESPVDRPRRDLALRPEDLESHWGPHARGVATHTDPGWLFTGRVELMRYLIDATTAVPHALLITGGAGSGKSAALARLVTLADPTFTATYAAQVATIPTQLRPEPAAVDVAVLATGKLPHEVLAQICDACNVTTPHTTAAPTLAELRTAWWSWLTTQTRPVTIVVDALDEASHPHSLLDEVLTQLDPPTAASSRVRLIVGVRSPSGDEPTPTRPVLADLAESKLHATRLRVDQSPLWSVGDVSAYVADVLRSTPNSPYAEADPATVDAVAGIIAGKAGTSYLVARLAATSLAARNQVIDPADATWLAALDGNVVGVFRDDLHTILIRPDDRERAVHLLRAVAFAYGRGLPWHKIWPLVANAVADHPERTYGDEDIAWLLDSRLGGYLVTDTEDDTTVYRLFHDALRGTLREQWRELLVRPTA